MRFRVGSLVACLVALNCTWIAGCGAPPPTPVDEVSADRYLDDVKFLASDDLSGRRPGTQGIERAADFIGARFAAAGLEPLGDDGTFFQHFEVVNSKQINPDTAALDVEGLEGTWELSQDWIPLPFSSTDSVSGPLAFAGYGIEAIEHNYNDYETFDAGGKILLIFRYEPADADPASDFGGEIASSHSYFAIKAELAAREGAKALLIVNPTRADLDDELYTFDEELSQQTFGLPMIHITRAFADAILSKAGMDDLDTLQEKLETERTPLSADLGLSIALNPGLEVSMTATRNVVGMLRGDGTTADTIVVGAHYDHVGNVPLQFDRVDETPYIHNGADDNASGTAGVLELVRVMASQRERHRNILFIAFSAEEMGLLGSKYFVDHPTIPLEQVRAMVNFDMIGRLAPGTLEVLGTYTAPEFPELVSSAAQAAGLECRTPAGIASDSDHADFNAHAIPVLFPFTGLHDQYHRPADDWELINADGAASILTMFRQIIVELATMPTGPTFQEDTATPEDL